MSRSVAPPHPTRPPVLADAVASLRTRPAPRGDGRTLHNWGVLARAGAEDLVAARLGEAHLDALTILSELGAPPVPTGSVWGVWAAESSTVGPVHATVDDHGGATLTGAKPWCSGAAGPCTDALVTARTDDGGLLFAVDLGLPGVTVRDDEWRGAGMSGAGTATVDLDAVPAVAVGGPGAYLDRPGFWHGAIAVAATWFGGAVATAGPLRRGGRDGRLDAHAQAHLGAADAALAAARSMLRDAAATVDAPAARDEPVDVARRRALQVRAVVETAVETVVRSTGRATGPGPLAHDADHARRVADLTVYVRQSHAERDLAALGALAADDATVL